jgi:hypothetical protein
MHDRIFRPLHCASSGFWQPLHPGSNANVASGHDEHGLAIHGGWLDYPQLAAAGAWQTASDLARILGEIHHAAAGRGAILDASSANALTSPTLPNAPSPASVGGALEGSGLALRLRKLGSQTGYNAEAVLVPSTGQGAAVMTNAAGGGRLVGEVVKLIAQAQNWPKIDAQLWK